MRRLGPEGRWTIKGVDWESHIDWRRERMPARMLGPEGGGGVDCESLPSRYVLKILRGSLKEKPQRQQYLLAMGNLERKFERKTAKKTISASCEFGLL